MFHLVAGAEQLVELGVHVPYLGMTTQGRKCRITILDFHVRNLSAPLDLGRFLDDSPSWPLPIAISGKVTSPTCTDGAGGRRKG
jgi:hypothetical protein